MGGTAAAEGNMYRRRGSFGASHGAVGVHPSANNNTPPRGARHGSKLVASFSPILLLSHLVVACLAWTGGLWMGKSIHVCPPPSGAASGGDNVLSQKAVLETSKSVSKSSSSGLEFPKTVKRLFVGAHYLPREAFAKHLDVGVPLDQTKDGNEEVLILYSPGAMPNPGSDATSPVDATANCNTVKVVLNEPWKKTCLAIMGQWDSYHVHKFMRVPEVPNLDPRRKYPLDSNLPLRYVSRTHQEGGRVMFPPEPKTTNLFWTYFQGYLARLTDVLDRLRPIATKVSQQSGGPIVVMVCNFGQSELFLNFVCNARARGMETNSILLFATDVETRELAESMGISVFYDEETFGEMPKNAARAYADKTFSRMMLAKVYCVHMINMLGYDLLFQDVDVVWYRDPLAYFKNKKLSGNFDMYFQDDGAHSVRYAPYSPNTGFYYVRHNYRTEFFFSVLLRMGDVVMGSGSHQSALTAVLNEHASWRGLTVKILSRDEDDFPGGFHYHRRKQFMKDLINGDTKPYAFHMSWTANKQNKRLYMEQMGDWYVQDQCASKEVSTILGNDADQSRLQETCCSKEPIIICHYRDKPSKIPCKDSPPIDKGRRSFW